MKVYDVVQGETPWYQARMGIPTASEFSKIITPATGAFSKQAEGYADTLIAEIYLKQPINVLAPTFWMERGKIMEIEAGDLYELTTGTKTHRAGFITDDLGHYGASPDRFVEDDGLIEIKCLAPQNHMKYLLKQEIDRDHYPQIQGQLLVCEDRQWVDWWMYHPEMPPVQIRTPRDEIYIAKLKSALNQFRDMMGEKIERLVELGHMDLGKMPPAAFTIPSGQTIISAG